MRRRRRYLGRDSPWIARVKLNSWRLKKKTMSERSREMKLVWFSRDESWPRSSLQLWRPSHTRTDLLQIVKADGEEPKRRRSISPSGRTTRSLRGFSSAYGLILLLMKILQRCFSLGPPVKLSGLLELLPVHEIQFFEMPKIDWVCRSQARALEGHRDLVATGEDDDRDQRRRSRYFLVRNIEKDDQNRYDTLATKVKSLLDPLAPCKFSHPVWIKTSMLSSPMRLLLVKARGLNSQKPPHHKLAVSARAPLNSLSPYLFFGRCC